MKRCLPGWLLLLLPCLGLAQERIRSYDIGVDIHADGSLLVTENITVRAEGDRIRRGIYREFPTRYKDRYGNRVVVDFEVVDVLRDGRPEPWFTERRSNGVVVNTGNDDFLPVPREYAYTLRYRTTRQLGFFDQHDELYWNAIGQGWVFPIESATVEVRLPQPVPDQQMKAEAFTGAQGERGSDYSMSLPAPGVARWRLARPLPPNQGMTVVLGFPKGVVSEPGATQRLGWLLKDNRGVLIALVGALSLLGYCIHRWRQVGRDPPAGVIIARYQPPEGHSPSGLRFMRRMSYDTRCFSADVLALAVGGNLRIQRDKGLLKDEWTLEKTYTPGALPAAGEQKILMGKLFAGGASELLLKNSNAAIISAAQSAHSHALEKRFKPAYFNRNGSSVLTAFAIAAISAMLAFLLGGGGGIPIIIGIAALMLATLIVFSVLIRAPTAEGRKLLDEIEGLKLYLGVAERDELKQLSGPEAPPLDAKRYEQLLPYAVALEVEDAWTRKFTAAAGAAAVAAATAGIGWYRGSGIGDLGSLSKAVGSGLSSQISSSSHAPGSSSGSGGGGSSGGGGGGGGGGGR
ncbi:Predicted membrane protein [Pseudoxanthomonas wuyuanensis]|uniref:Predicted membrane protein n=1 Tax=Pseudoxanthomonas wuyuanensis TaxID=1073196 RepID=A0A286DDV4_9GAMM|nr:DUF2207 domain-containing protein [Pseudoxanthomonas wuyuanensis]SOD56820.1 Predicted membrane protein [Pseudoxanthomonas wuyuanensis]